MNESHFPSDVHAKLASLRQRCAARRGALNGIRASIRDCESRCTALANLVRSAGNAQARAEYSAKLERARAEYADLAATVTAAARAYADDVRSGAYPPTRTPVSTTEG